MKNEQLSLMLFPFDVDILYHHMTLSECFALAKNAGISLVDVMNVPKESIPVCLDAMKKTGIKVQCYIGSISFFSTGEQEITEAFQNHLRAAERLAAKLLMLVPVNVQKDEAVCARLGKAGVRQRLVRCFSEAVSMARNSGIKVCFETTPQDYTCLSGAEDCLWILNQVPELGLIYDTANMLPHGDDPLRYYEALKDHILHTHLKDVMLSEPGDQPAYEKTWDGKAMRCCVSGEGVIPLKDIMTHMVQDGYSGTFALEYCHPEKYPADLQLHTRQLEKHMAFWNDNTDSTF